jgi:hypothetical protein
MYAPITAPSAAASVPDLGLRPLTREIVSSILESNILLSGPDEVDVGVDDVDGAAEVDDVGANGGIVSTCVCVSLILPSGNLSRVI